MTTITDLSRPDLSRPTTRARARDAEWPAALEALSQAVQAIIDAADDSETVDAAAMASLRKAQFGVLRAPAPNAAGLLTKAELALIIKHDIRHDQLPELLGSLSASPSAADVAEAAIVRDLERLAGI